MPSISAFEYMRAHGNTPGPTHRPLLTGAVSGLIGFGPALLIEYAAETLDSESAAVGLGVVIVSILTALIAVVAGMIYSYTFQRAANDIRGGWLFGSSYGFLIWMIGPVAAWQLMTQRPLATGVAAMGLFGACVAYGLVLGLAYPVVNRSIQKRLRSI